jgi:3-hydroxyisobutyrate dehydrogenase-like beta-hydroxyacid dehydrogenase
LPMPDIVTAVALGPQGLRNGTAVQTVIDLSTTGPRAAAVLANGLLEKSIDTIDCPVSGGVAGATKGTLALMVSGKKSRFEEVQPILSTLGKLFYVGEVPGMAQTMKVLNNLISVTSLAITSEAMVMGAKAGLDADTMIEVINAGSGRTSASADKIPNFVLTRGFNFGFALGLSAKDVRLCLEESEQLGVPMKVGDAVRQFLNAAKDKFGAQADMTEMIRLVEEAAGVEVHGKASQRS